MMGTQQRNFAPLVNVSLEALVPADNFYRHLERTLDLSFVREFVQETYAQGGRPSIDPIVFFKLQLVLFFEGIRSERQLMRHAADRLSILWYLGYDLGEPLPDHSSLTRIRTRYGIEVFRRFFEAVVEQCQQAGLVRKQPRALSWKAISRHAKKKEREADPLRREQQSSSLFPPQSPRNSTRTSANRIPSAMTGLSSWEHKIAG